MGLPPNPHDARVHPTETYMWVQDLLTIGSGLLWTAAYALYIRQSYRDQSYGMPILALCCNITWEFLYSVVYPPGTVEMYGFMPWIFIDLVLMYATVKFGPREWKHSPLVAQNLTYIILFLTAVFFAGHYAFVIQFKDITDASFFSGYFCQIIVSCFAIAQLISRGHTRGHSMGIWYVLVIMIRLTLGSLLMEDSSRWLRFVGTILANGVFYWRNYHYPEHYAYVVSPVGTFLLWAPQLGELAYPFVYKYVERIEKGQIKVGKSL